jgi:hypothetical protein
LLLQTLEIVPEGGRKVAGIFELDLLLISDPLRSPGEQTQAPRLELQVAVVLLLPPPLVAADESVEVGPLGVVVVVVAVVVRARAGVVYLSAVAGAS